MNKIIIGKRIYLKELCEDDASQQYCDWLNNPDVNKYMTTKKTTIEELKQYIGKRNGEIDMLAAIIQARMGSTRLPKKVMLNILEKPILWHVINRVSKASLIDKLIVATTTNNEDDAIVEFCKNNGILFFRGSENDVLDRYYQCAKEYNITDIARITADCPLHDPNVIDMIIKEYMGNDYDYVSNSIEYTFPDGLDVEIFSFDALKIAWENAKLFSEREHVTPYMRKCKEFKKRLCIQSKNIHYIG